MTVPPLDVLEACVDPDDVVLVPSVQGEWLAAVHEAGHVVIAIACGYEPKEVSIEGAYLCRAHLQLPDGQPLSGVTTRSTDEEEADAMYTLAGGKAELLFVDNGGVEQLSSSDREEFSKMRPADSPSLDLGEWRARMELATDEMVSRYRAEIEAIARELLVRRRIGGETVRRLMRK
jgi:hypothetical protein